MFADSVKFICKFLANPKTTGALCPSSCFLARQMAANCPESGLIIELGAGSGSVTAEILKKAEKICLLKMIKTRYAGRR